MIWLLLYTVIMNLSYSLRKAVFIGSAIVSFSTVLLSALPSRAQIGLSPLFLEEQAVRGKSQGVITLMNSADRPIRVRLYSEAFTYGREGFMSLEEDPVDLSPYLQFSPREVVIPAKTEQRIRLMSLFPPGLPDGEYRATVFAEELAESTVEENATAISVRIGSTVYVHQGELSPVLSGLSAQLASDQSALELLVGNQGLATARPGVTWQIEQSGTAIAQGETSPYTVIAGGDRTFSLALPTALSSGSYILRGSFSWMTHGEISTEPFELPVLVP